MVSWAACSPASNAGEVTARADAHPSTVFGQAAGPEQTGGPGQERPGRVLPKKEEQRVTDESEVPDETIDDCGLDAGGPNEGRWSTPDGTLDPHVTFALKFQDEVSAYRLMSTMVMPGEELEIEAVLTGRTGEFQATADGGELTALGPEAWRWDAPEKPGSYCIKVTEVTTDEAVCLRAFVLVPYDGSPTLNGYRIGAYQRVPLFDDPAYNAPTGFIEVTEENLDTWVSPHFQLSQFVCKQQSGFPKYMLLQPRLLLKLELLLEQVNDEGIETDSFFVMSGFRTPHYNASIGNKTKYSRHTYGDAADVFVDRDRNGTMDDIDGDGRVTKRDAVRMQQIVEGMTDNSWYRPFVGGLGLYGPAPHRGPFIHVDTRGRRARW